MSHLSKTDLFIYPKPASKPSPISLDNNSPSHAQAIKSGVVPNCPLSLTSHITLSGNSINFTLKIYPEYKHLSPSLLLPYSEPPSLPSYVITAASGPVPLLVFALHILLSIQKSHRTLKTKNVNQIKPLLCSTPHNGFPFPTEEKPNSLQRPTGLMPSPLVDLADTCSCASTYLAPAFLLFLEHVGSNFDFQWLFLFTWICFHYDSLLPVSSALFKVMLNRSDFDRLT